MRVYISGAINSPVPDVPKRALKERFYAAEEVLARLGHIVVNPLRVGACPDGRCKAVSADLDEGHTWACWLKYDIKAMLTCDAIYLLPDWHFSRGATFEFDVAVRCGMEVMFA